MIENLTVENYRSFKNYSMHGLKRVNLLTGYNNSGKTSLLEAVEMLASAGEPRCLLGISKRRNESHHIEASSASIVGDPSHFFFNREFGRPIHVKSENWNATFTYHQETPQNEGNKLVIDRDGTDFTRPQVIVRLGDLNAFGYSKNVSSWGGMSKLHESFCPVEFIGTREIEPKKLAELWDDILVSKSEGEPAESLRILDGEIETSLICLLVRKRDECT